MGDRDRHPVNFLNVPVAEADVRFGTHYGLNSDTELGPKSAMKRHERDLHALANGSWRSRRARRRGRANDGNCLTALRKQRTNIYP
jgi:hypothetical protein